MPGTLRIFSREPTTEWTRTEYDDFPTCIDSRPGGAAADRGQARRLAAGDFRRSRCRIPSGAFLASERTVELRRDRPANRRREKSGRLRRRDRAARFARSAASDRQALPGHGAGLSEPGVFRPVRGDAPDLGEARTEADRVRRHRFPERYGRRPTVAGISPVYAQTARNAGVRSMRSGPFRASVGRLRYVALHGRFGHGDRLAPDRRSGCRRPPGYAGVGRPGRSVENHVFQLPVRGSSAGRLHGAGGRRVLHFDDLRPVCEAFRTLFRRRGRQSVFRRCGLRVDGEDVDARDYRIPHERNPHEKCRSPARRTALHFRTPPTGAFPYTCRSAS